MLENVPVEIEKAYKEALIAQANSHSPYSNFPVGAAIKFKDIKELAVGCNVENISFGGTICAERSAIVSFISKNGKKDIEYAVVVANTKSATLPCAFCLQVMSEFTNEDFPIYMGNQTALLKKLTFKDLLPHSFDTLHEKS
tara:strand:- start:51 stop:473 length:423 start_codon:yes stop_codon:yes gene_type:complete